MNYKMMGRLNAMMFGALTVFMIPALLIGIFDGTRDAWVAFLISMGITAALAGVLFFLCRGAKRNFYAKEGLVFVGVSWIALSLAGALPLCLSGAIPNYIDALFEIVSGFTTTGASILSEVESLPRAVLYWRSFSHWLGGMGVLVFLLALMPVSGRNQGFTLHLMRAESPGPTVGKLVPKIRQTAAILYLCYIALTVLNTVFLLIGKMPLFDAVCTAFGTAGTGGFGIKNDSLTSYSPYIQIVTTVFMMLFGVNFSCYYLLLLGKLGSIFRDEEFRMYVGLFFGSAILIFLNIRKMYAGIGEALRHSFFQVATIMTTTGYSTADFDLWPTFSKTVLLLLMVVGAMAGSTGGGFKCSRVLLLVKNFIRNVKQVLHPAQISTVRVNGKRIDEKVVSNTNAYLFAYVTITAVSFLLLSLDPFSTDVITPFSAVVACFNNIGPGLSAVGPACNYGGFHWASKLILSVDMLAGRLEIFPILVLMSPGAWKRG